MSIATGKARKAAREQTKKHSTNSRHFLHVRRTKGSAPEPCERTKRSGTGRAKNGRTRTNGKTGLERSALETDHAHGAHSE